MSFFIRGRGVAKFSLSMVIKSLIILMACTGAMSLSLDFSPLVVGHGKDFFLLYGIFLPSLVGHGKDFFLLYGCWSYYEYILVFL